MTSIYESKVIYTVEQAEALPLGTVLVHYDDQGSVWQSGLRVRGGVEFSGASEVLPCQWAVGTEALLPVELEIEMDKGIGYDLSGPYEVFYSRLVTEWREE